MLPIKIKKWALSLLIVSAISACGGGTNTAADPAVLILSALTALFPVNGGNWNDYVAGDSLAAATDVACDAATDTACFHGGEHRVVSVSGTASCAGLTATDTLGAFNWICDNNAGSIRFISTGLADGKYLSDLIDFTTSTFRPNSLTVAENGGMTATTASSAWWSNPLLVDNDGGSLGTASTIYLVTIDPAQAYTIDDNKVGMVVQPGVTLTGPGTTTNVLASTSQNFLWLEGSINASGDNRGVSLSSVHFSKIRNLSASNAIAEAVFITGSRNNKIFDVNASNSAGVGFQLDNGSTNNTISGLSANNGGRGVMPFSVSNNHFSNITTHNNSDDGISVSSSDSNTFSAITATNNIDDGIRIENGSDNNTVSGMAGSNNFIRGAYLSLGSNNTFSDFATANNSVGIFLQISSNSIFTGLLNMGNNGAACFVTVDLGLVAGTCANGGNSDATLTTGISLANSFVGKVSTDDAQNADDTNGSVAAFPNPATFDWLNFDNRYRGWGIDGSAFPNADHQGQWTTGAGRIWDWSVATGDTGNAGNPALLGARPVPGGNDTLTHVWNGVPATADNIGCNTLVTGSTYNGANCETTFLRRAVEILNDGLGNENLLCESTEACLYTPNFGSYQGHGSLVSAGAFTDGAITGVILLQYDTNGR